MVTTSLTWNITDLRRDTSDNFVTEIKYSITGICTETVGGASTEYSHVITGGHLVPDLTRTGSEIPFEDLTETQIISWVKAGIGSTEVAMFEDIIPRHLDGERKGCHIVSHDLGDFKSGLPW